MRLIPVLDLMNGVVVQGRGGHRDEYRPIQSRWSDDATAENVARGLFRAYGFREFYVADLDAIVAQRPNVDLWRRLVDQGYRLLIDAGIGDPETARRVTSLGAVPVVGLESCASPAALQEIVSAGAGVDLVFSLDLVGGEPKTLSPAWPNNADQIASEVVAAGVRRLIVLDLAGVGMNQGVRGFDRIQMLRQQYPDVELITGGGVRGPDDLQSLDSAGVAGVLVASSLHNGVLIPEQVERWRQSP